jgi:hypothetical protein
LSKKEKPMSDAKRARPREFWIARAEQENFYALEVSEEEIKPDEPVYRGYDACRFTPDEIIHVREVKPIDWPKIWEQIGKETLNEPIKLWTNTIQDLVEKSLRGEYE